MTIESRFIKFHDDNPHVYEQFKFFAFQAIAAGVRKMSSKFLIERIRWDALVTTSAKDFKINNDFTSRYSRMFISEYPVHADLFDTREILTA